jgi:hypothetical protein
MLSFYKDYYLPSVWIHSTALLFLNINPKTFSELISGKRTPNFAKNDYPVSSLS